MKLLSYLYFFLSNFCRSTKLARLDGVEQTALILGVCVSPFAFHHWGYTGCFVFRVIGGLLALLYLRKRGHVFVLFYEC